ncbi:MAG: GFA family protein [Methylococcales symbiont of Iophon sp. n. MRB-2018]|nr:MAG: GFA family protein [Methylococcales symbiont of Iophon sp. n. MRB-2018]KAF3979065.1 MAG: GFA family protein [Methylococcales symbiont of Iophon sp. n. MRB-2018]
MKLPITGGCLCGKVKYQITRDPVGAGNCHCRTCQKALGAAYLAVLFVPYEALKITGEYKEFATLSASANTIHRGFCAKCGSALFGRNSANNKIRPVCAATLDDPSIYQPNMDFWVSEAQPWDYMNPDLTKFEGNFLHF